MIYPRSILSLCAVVVIVVRVVGRSYLSRVREALEPSRPLFLAQELDRIEFVFLPLKTLAKVSKLGALSRIGCASDSLGRMQSESYRQFQEYGCIVQYEYISSCSSNVFALLRPFSRDYVLMLALLLRQ